MSSTRTTAAVRFSLPFGDLLGVTLSTFFRNFVPFTVMGAIVMSPWAALVLYLAPVLSEGPPRSREELFEYFLAQGGAFVLQQLLGYLLTGSVVFGVVQQMRGQPAGMGLSLQTGFRNLGRSLGTGLLVGLRILLFCLPSALLVLGATQVRFPLAVPIAFLVALGLLVPAVMEFVRLYVAIPAAVMEEKGGGPAIARSKGLTDGSRWPIFGGLVVVGIGTGMVAGLLTFVVMLAAGGPKAAGGGMAVSIVTIALTIVGQALGATMMAVCYFQLRRGKENVDPKTLAAVFD